MGCKDKAIEIVAKYRALLSLPNQPLGNLKDEIAKQCALVAVDEILKYNNKILLDSDRYKFWKEVKKEIENL